MKVYVLQFQKWEDHYIVGIFTTRELAEKYLKELAESARKGFNICNYDITEEVVISE